MALARARSFGRSTIAIILILAFVVACILTAPADTQNSPFYKKTIELMDAKGRPRAHEATKRWPNWADHQGDQSAMHDRHLNANENGARIAAIVEAPVFEPPPEQSLKERLKEAEKLAKKSADERYRALRDIEAEVQKDREARRQAAASDLMEPAVIIDHPRSLRPGEKSIAGRTKMPINPQKAPVDDLALENLKATIDYTSPLTPQPGETEEERDVRETYASIIAQGPIIIFSKTYCPFSKKAKRILLEDYTITPSPVVIELDQHPVGPGLQHYLERTTGRRTVPNVLVSGKTIGGGDEVELLSKSGELPARLRQMGGKRLQKVVENEQAEKNNLVHQALRV